MTSQVDGAFQLKYSAPGHQYEDTKVNIEALVGVTAGAVAFATDTKQLGTYNGVSWDWGGGGGGVMSVTGDGVDNTDPANPVISYPTPGDIGAATAAQGALADTALQPGDVGTAAYADTTDFDPAGAASTAQSNAEAYADSLVVGLWDDRGNYDASVNAYPSSGGSGTAGAILKGDIWTISVAGTLPIGQVVEPGDTVRALIDTPGNTQANWAIAQNNIGYVPAPASRLINTTLPLTGGGDLTADRTLAINPATETAAGSMSAADKIILDNLPSPFLLMGA